MAFKSKGVLFKIGTAAAGTAIADIYSVTPPAFTQSFEDATTHDQADDLRRIIATLAEHGELEVQCGVTATNIADLNAVKGVDNTAFSIVFGQTHATTPISMDFEGLLTNMQIDSAPVDGKLTMTLGVKVNGDVTWNNVA